MSRVPTRRASTAPPGRRLLVAATGAAAVLVTAFWCVWFTRRDWLVTDPSPSYLDWEGSFPVADAFVVVTSSLACRALATRRPTALLWLLVTGGAAAFLTLIDVTYSIQHSVYAQGPDGLLEAVIEILLASYATLTILWSWRHREALLAPRPAR